ncbi:MAG: 8-oxoguanine deaminase [Spirochaetes bacterium]|nr:8-oxoguanine deaminase [Spirochaetota bacterium]
MSSLLIKEADLIVTMDRKFTEIKNGDIYIEGPEIKEIGKGLKAKADKVINASGMVVYPGFVNTHHHFYQTLTRNIPKVQDAKLFDWLINLYELWREIDSEAIYYSTLVAISELLLTGCTTTSDHLYLFPQAIKENLIDEEIKAAEKAGMRFIPTRGSMSRGKSDGGLPPDDVIQSEDEIILDSERLIQKYHNPDKFSMLKIALAPCSPFSVTTELMKQTAELSKKYHVRCHTHIAETMDENEFCLQEYGKRPVAYMEEAGWLGENFWFAHCVHLNDDEIRVMAKTKTGVAHCPVSNLRLGSGIAPIGKMLESGVHVSLGVDGSASNDSSNFLFEMKTAMLIHRVRSGVDSMPARKVLSMATKGGAKVLGWDEIGSLEKGKAADLAIFDLNTIGYAGALHDKASAILYAGNSQTTAYTIVNGEVLVEKGKLTKIKTEEVIRKANEISAKMIRKASAKTGIDFYSK